MHCWTIERIQAMSHGRAVDPLGGWHLQKVRDALVGMLLVLDADAEPHVRQDGWTVERLIVDAVRVVAAAVNRRCARPHCPAILGEIFAHPFRTLR